jgi:HAD superfamily hydrolase (TIGR01490 family)
MRDSRVAAFFDLDRTLLRVNSARKWVEYERREGRIGRLQVAQAALWLLCYKFGVVDMDAAIGRAVATLKGVLEDEVARRTHRWYDEHIAETILSQAREMVEHHRRQGHHLVLLTSSSPYISEKVQLELELDHFLCTRFEVVDGRFTGRPVLPLCYGPGKVLQARAWAATAGVELEQSYFYTDSLTDLPMLEAVGHPRVVNPDPRLRRLARRRGWPVEDWDRVETRGRRRVQETPG